MAIKLYYAPNEFYKEPDEPEGSWGNAITCRWAVGPCVLMRINVGDYLVAMKEENVPKDILTAPGVVEILNWNDGAIDITEDMRTFISTTFGIPKGRINKNWKMLEFSSRFLKRVRPYFDVNTLFRKIEEGKIYYIDLTSDEMDL